MAHVIYKARFSKLFDELCRGIPPDELSARLFDMRSYASETSLSPGTELDTSAAR